MPTSLRADSNEYSKCNNSTLSCGSITNLTYPFWGENRPKYCGEPNLEITCENGFPKFSVGSVKYRILAWDIKTQNLKVAMDDYFDSVTSICSSDDYKNNTLDNTVFQYDDGNIVNVTLLYNCSTPLSNSFKPLQNCSPDVYFAQYMPNNVPCMNVVFPVTKAEAQVVASNPSAIQGVLQQGLGLKWASYEECNKCVESGGACGNDGGQFACFCKDGFSCSSDSGMFLNFVNTWLAAF